MKWKTVLLLICTVGFFVSCSSSSVNEDNPESMYKDAQEDIEGDRYQIAIEKLQKIKAKFPYSNFSALAALRLGDVYFLQESFAEAAAAYEAFVELHPKHEKVPYASFRVGESHFQDIPSVVARDLTSANEALAAFEMFVKKFPSDPQFQEAKKRVQDTRNVLAEKELYIANFYYKRDFTESAYDRFSKIVTLYPETPSAQEAKKRREDTEKEITSRKKNPPLSDRGTPTYKVYAP